MIQKIIQFLKSYNFTKGLIISTTAFSAVTFCYFYLNTTIGAGTAFGVLLASTSDIPGNKKHHIYGIFISLFLAVLSYVIIHLTIPYPLLLIPSLAILVFLNSYISVYGFRASLIAFSGLLAVSLSFAHPLSGIDILYNVLYITCGGIWYLLISLTFESVRTKQYSDELLTECMQLTAEYLNTRVTLFSTTDRESVLNRQLSLQNELNEKHETLRSILLRQRQRSGSMKSKRQQLLIFIELIDILEFAIANPLNYKKFDKSSDAFKKVAMEIATVMEAVANRLIEISNSRLKGKKIPQNTTISIQLESANREIEELRLQIDLKKDREEILILINLYDYTERQFHKINTIENIVINDLVNKLSILKRTDRLKFITAQDYSYKILFENLTLKSPIFKHSLRLVVTVLIGYAIGSFFKLQNAYWIILTIIVIMRPGYVLTKERSQQRIIGTLIGGAIAVGIVLLNNNLGVYIAITFIAMTLSFTFIQQNYKASAVFITLTIVFVYAMLSTDALTIIKFRIIDTFIGTIIASITNLILWPSWESENMANLITNAITTNKKYLQEVKYLYHDKKIVKTPYKISRKHAFIAIGNLHAGFQRMTQEPKWKQQNLNKLYKIVVIQNTLLSATASLGTYIQIHHTTDASKYFDAYMTAIDNQLGCSEAILKKEAYIEIETLNLEETKNYLRQIFENLSQKRNSEIDAGMLEINSELREQLKEIRIISEQLEWLHNLSKNLHTAINGYKGRV